MSLWYKGCLIECKFFILGKAEHFTNHTWALVDPFTLAARAGSTIAGFRAYVALSISIKQLSD